MATLRFELSLSIPESPTGTTILQTTNPDGSKSGGIKLPAGLVSHLAALRSEIQLAKSYARKINAGQPNEEMTVRAVMRLCYHDEGEGHKPCEGEQEI